MQKVGAVALDLNLNEKGFNSQLKSIGNMAKKVGATIAGAFAIKKVVDFGKDCIELGSDLTEVQNVVDVAFPKMNKTIDKFAKNAASQFGLSETMAKRYAGTFGSMSKAFGFSEKEAAEMSTTLTGLSGDVASFYNISQDEAYTKLKSVFTGETESLKDLGVVMTQTALDQFALQNGFGKTTAKMTEQEKVALRYAFVQKQLTDASGDFARTSDSWANQTRILNLQFESLKANIGQGLINVFAPVLKLINTLLAKLSTLASAFKSFTEMLTGNKNEDTSVSETSDDLKGIKDNADGATSGMDGLAKSTKKAAKAANGLANFDNLNVMQQDSDSSTSGSGSGTNIDYGSINKSQDSALSNLDKKAQKVFDNILKKIEPTTEALKRLYSQGLKKLGDFAWDSLKGFYENFLKPVGEWVLGEGLPRFIDTLNEGLMNVDFDKINDSLNSLWNALAPFAINVGKGLLWFWENVLVPLGTWVANEVVPRFLETLAQIINVLNATIEALKPAFKWFWDNVLQPLASWTGNLFLGAWDLINKGLSAFSDWCSEHPGTIQGMTAIVAGFFAAWKSTELMEWMINAGGVVSILKKIKDAVTAATVAKIKDKIETIELAAMYAKETAAKIASKVATVAATVAEKAMALAQAGLNVIMSANPIGLIIIAIAGLVAAFVLLWNKCDAFRNFFIKLWEIIKEKAGVAINAIKTIFTGFWKNVKGGVTNAISIVRSIFVAMVSWFKEKVIQPIKSVFTGLWDKLKSGAKSVWDGITSVFIKIPNWFKDKFKQAWEGVKNVFSKGGKIFTGIKEGIVSVFKTVVNGLIGGINKVVKIPFDAINGMLNKIRDVKIMKWHPFHDLWEQNPLAVPQIPKLAKGAVLKPNAPFLAMVGDQKNGTNIEAPLETIKQALRDVQNESNKGTGGNDNIVVNVFLKGDADGVFNLVKTEAKKYKNRTGTPAFN